MEENAQYAWYDCETNMQMAGADQQSFVPAVNSSYNVQVTLNGCEAISECIEVIVISVDEESPIEVLVYPNPARDYVLVKCPTSAMISIFNTEGKMVLQSSVNSGQERIDLNGIPSGLYDVMITGNSLKAHHKLSIGNEE